MRSTFFRIAMALLLALTFVVSIGVYQIFSGHSTVAYALANPHNCDALALAGTTSSGVSSPFHAVQIPTSPPYSWGSNSVVACQYSLPQTTEQPYYNNFQNAISDGYGNPFQCVELIARYSSIRYGDAVSKWNNPTQNAAGIWNYNAYPSHYTKVDNGGSGLTPGVILIWNGSGTNVGPDGHIAIVIGVAATQIAVLEQNVQYGKSTSSDGKRSLPFFTVKRTFSVQRIFVDGQYWWDISGANATVYYQNGTSSHVNYADPAGWLKG
jgi:hypothetical protein